MRAAELLGPAGPFAVRLEHYEPRAGQQALAAAVEQCLEQGGIALVEAGTGTGKSLGYLVPALRAASSGRVVISTATRTLQDQLFDKDLPVALKVLGVDIKTAVLKGLPNYLCRTRWDNFRSSGEMLHPRYTRSLPLVQDWMDRTHTGAFDELHGVSEDDPILGQVSSSSETRIGSGCEHYERCFVTRAKRAAAEAALVVVNHHLFLADLAIRGEHAGAVLPAYDAVILDEAHQLQSIATQYFGCSISTGRLSRLIHDGAGILRRWGHSEAQSLPLRVLAQSQGFFDALQRAASGKESKRLLGEDVFLGAVRESWFELDGGLDELHTVVGSLVDGESDANQVRPPGHEDISGVQRRLATLRDELSEVVEGSAAVVRWLEVTAGARVLAASPVDVAQPLGSRLFDLVPSIVLTSATLTDRKVPPPPAAAGEVPRSAFEYFRHGLGLDKPREHLIELVVDSPFEFSRQALLYAPKDLPLPSRPEFFAAFARRSVELIEQTPGGAFVLTTSIRSLRATASTLRTHFGVRRPVLAQGEAPKAELLAQFRERGAGVLVGTLSFWQGVDIPGAALRLVVLEKLPFPVPTDPVLVARSKRLEEMGESPFARLHLPHALLTLKQGFGRLIRSESDFGVVALLDGRLHSRGYGRRMLSALPDAPVATSLEEVQQFWDSWSNSA